MSAECQLQPCAVCGACAGCQDFHFDGAGCVEGRCPEGSMSELEQVKAERDRLTAEVESLKEYVHERLSELREFSSQEPRGYTLSAYLAQIEELERLEDEAGWSTNATAEEER